MIKYYILVDPDKPERCKIGITKNPDQRIRAYRTANPDCYFLEVYELPHKSHEKRILDMLRGVFTVRSEYIHGNPKTIQSMIECYFDECGIDY